MPVVLHMALVLQFGVYVLKHALAEMMIVGGVSIEYALSIHRSSSKYYFTNKYELDPQVTLPLV